MGVLVVRKWGWRGRPGGSSRAAAWFPPKSTIGFVVAKKGFVQPASLCELRNQRESLNKQYFSSRWERRQNGLQLAKLQSRSQKRCRCPYRRNCCPHGHREMSCWTSNARSPCEMQGRL